MKFGELPAGYSVRFYEPRDREGILALEEKQHDEWLERGVDSEIADPDDAQWGCTVVVVDENDRPVACMAARRVAEVMLTLDKDRLPLRSLMSVLARAWGKLAVTLYGRGYGVALCRISSPTPKWGNMIVKRAKWEADKAPLFIFDLEKQIGAVKPR